MKREAEFQTTFNHWLKAIYKENGVFELKQTQTNSIAFNKVVPHQVQALLRTQEGHLIYKIPDGSFTQSPYDCISLCNIQAFVVIRYPGFFCLINIRDWINEKERSDRRSLAMNRAREIATTIVPL